MQTLEEITTEMVEHICDHICVHTDSISRREMSQEVLDATCSECRMGKFICDIKNTGIKFDKLYREKCEEVNKLQEQLSDKGENNEYSGSNNKST